MGDNCKYSGGNNYCQALVDHVAGHEVFAVCPEVMGGLPTPRIPCEIVDGIVTNREGVSCDKEFRAGAAMALEIAKKEQIDLAILQSRSPSCGIHQVYDGTFSKTLKEGMGVLAQLLKENGFRLMDVEELNLE